MVNNSKQLLCTFIGDKDLYNIIRDIKDFYKNFNNLFFLFESTKDKKQFLTYNVENISVNNKKYPNTILIHRKKQTNTFYTLNALNTLIKDEVGDKDENYKLDWTLYKNTLIISSDISVNIIPIKLITVIENQKKD